MAYPFKICDPIHGFIRFGEIERRVIDSQPFQRLRYIHQMGAAYLVYPGATHSRFEHSLGVMELVTRVFNTLISEHNQLFPFKKSSAELDYWRQVLRLAALCHDLGHLPFSHTAENTLLPLGGHEKMTVELIHSPELLAIWREIGCNAAKDIAALASQLSGSELSPWEKVLAYIITEDNFGADRIDYLVRDGRYTGVGYGNFDYQQLIDSLRILQTENGWALGVVASGVQSVESLWIARYLMYSRVYQHPKTRVYSYHLHRFMKKYYRGEIELTIEEYLEQTDYTILHALAQACKKGDYDSLCLLKRVPPFSEILFNNEKLKDLALLKKIFGEDVFLDEKPQKEISRIFPVYENGKVIPSFQASTFLATIPSGGKPSCLFAHPHRVEEISNML